MQSDNQLSVPDKIVTTVSRLRDKPLEEIREQLISLVTELINTDFHALVQLLYRIDVDEKKVTQLLQQHAGSDSASIISDLIISRQLQKTASGNQYGNKNEIQPDSW